MGNFRQHITCSTITGIALGGVGYSFGLPVPTCLLSAGLCSIAGMFPDIDSDTSRSFQECIYLAAGIAAVLFVQRLRHISIDPDLVLVGGAAMFLFVRFGIGELVKKTTSHRGMFHSIPAAIFSGEIVFFLSTGTSEERIFKAFALSSGYLSHLILDETCSVDSNGRVKKSFGTALKWFGTKKIPANLILYAFIIGMGMTAFQNSEIGETAKQFVLVVPEVANDAESDNKLNEKLNEKINEVKNNFQTLIQQEAAAYLTKKEKTVLSDSEPRPLVQQISVSTGDDERRLFSRKQRRPVSGSESNTATTRTPLSPQPEFQYDLPSSSDGVFGTDFRKRNNYQNFMLPNREPATVVLP
ncbi:MAG: metal-dependent hydrolase [Planctomycetaceae bacterium]|nr:metal-dependent hydrolase [Planctomycetaceae bacterium]